MLHLSCNGYYPVYSVFNAMIYFIKQHGFWGSDSYCEIVFDTGKTCYGYGVTLQDTTFWRTKTLLFALQCLLKRR